MINTRTTYFFILSIFFLIFFSSLVYADLWPGDEPNQFKGNVTVDSVIATAGVPVFGYVNNVFYNNATTDASGDYALTVGGHDGDTVTFKVYGVTAGTHTFEAYTETTLNLAMNKSSSGGECTYGYSWSDEGCSGSLVCCSDNLCKTTCVTSTGGGGGGGATTTTTTISFTTAGVNVSLGLNSIARFAFGGAYHTIKVIKVGADYVTLEIASDPVTVTLNLLKSKKLDLNNDNYYDLYVKLNEIKSSKAYLTVKYIHEIITPVVTPPAEEEEEEEPEEVPEELPEEVIEEPEEEATPEEEEIPPAKPKTAMIIVLIIALLALIGFLIYEKKKRY